MTKPTKTHKRFVAKGYNAENEMVEAFVYADSEFQARKSLRKSKFTIIKLRLEKEWTL